MQRIVFSHASEKDESFEVDIYQPGIAREGSAKKLYSITEPRSGMKSCALTNQQNSMENLPLRKGKKERTAKTGTMRR